MDRVSRDSESAILRCLLFTTSEIVVFKDVHLQILACSDTFCRIAGKGDDEIIGHDDFDIWPSDLAQRERDEDRHILKTGEAVRVARAWLTTDGPQCVSIEKTLWQDDAGRPAGVMVVAHRVSPDIGGSDLTLFLETTPDLIVFKGLDLRIAACSRAYAELHCRTATGIVGKSDRDLYPNELASLFVEEDRRILAGSKVEVAEHFLTTSRGDRWYEAVKKPLVDERGQLRGLLCCERDITEHKLTAYARSVFADSMMALYQTSLEINAQQDVGSLLSTIVRRAVELVRVRTGGVYLVEPDGEHIRMMAGYNLPDEFYDVRLRRGEGMAGAAIAANRPVNVADYQEWSLKSSAFPPARFRRFLSVPIRCADEILGVLCVTDDEHAGEFGDDEMRMVSLFADQAGLALKNLRLFGAAQQELKERKKAEQELEARLRETLLLNRVIGAVSSAGEPNAILETICEELSRAFDVPQAAVALANEDRTELHVTAEYCAPGRPPALGQVIPVGDNPATQCVLSTGKPLAILDAQNDPRQTIIHDLQRKRGTASLLIVPIPIRGEVIGTIGLDSLVPREFTFDEIALAESVGKSVGQGLEAAELNARLRLELAERSRTEKALERYARGMADLYETSLEINAQQDVPTLLQAIVRRASRLVGVQMGALYLMCPDGQAVELAVGYNLPPGYERAVLRLGEGVSGRVAATGQTMMIQDHRSWKDSASMFAGGPFRRVLAVPLKSGDRVLGVINVTDTVRSGPFDEQEVQVVSLFADQAAIALENARLYQALQRELTERQRAEDALRRERDFVETILDTTEALIALLDPRGRILMFNRKCEEVTGFREEELLGQVLWERLIPATEVSRIAEALAFDGGQIPPSLHENAWLTKDGRIVPIIWSNAIVPGEGGAPELLVASGLDITERLTREKEIQQRNKELSTLYRVMQAASTSLDPIEVFRQVGETLAEVGGYPIVSTFVKVGDEFVACGLMGGAKMHPPGLGRGIHGRMMRTGLPQFVGNVHKDPDYVAISDEICSEICVPVLVDGEIVGTVNVESDAEMQLSDSDYRLMLAIADQLSLLMRNVLLHLRLKTERDHVTGVNGQLIALQQVSTAVLSQPDVAGLLNTITQSAAELVAGSGACILLIDEDGQPSVRAAFNLNMDLLHKACPLLGPRLISLVAERGESVILRNSPSDPYMSDIAGATSLFQSMVSVPLFVGKTIVGTLNVIREGEELFDSDDLQILTLMANQAAVSIEKAELYAATAESELLYRSVFEDNLDGIVLVGAENGEILESNTAFQTMLGYSESELKGRPIYELRAPHQREAARRGWMELMDSGQGRGRVVPYRAKDGRSVEADFSSRIVELGGRRVEISSVRDVTETQRLEEQLRQVQKMEAVGTLASGIAHDFNNILGAILGYASFLKGTFSSPDPRRTDIEVIENSARRGAELTSQLLAFARGGPHDVKPVSVNAVVEEIVRLLSRTVDKAIAITTALGCEGVTVDGDAGQIQQLLLNLCLNACEAMPAGGYLTIETQKTIVDPETAQRELAKPAGEYILLTVADTGSGMDSEALQHIFEPFFSTKRDHPGKKHSGLGLATVFGIVRGHNGVIRVESDLGRGTTFQVWLPAGTMDPVEEMNAAQSTARGGNETILVVDDEVPIRELMKRVLTQAGYHVILAEDGRRALDAMRTYAGRIDMVILDMVMPGMGGLQTFELLQQMDPGVRVLVATGYSDKMQAKEVLSRGAQGFMQKPFTLQDMLRKVRTVLDEGHK